MGRSATAGAAGAPRENPLRKLKRGYQWNRLHLRGYGKPRDQALGHRKIPCSLCAGSAWYVVGKHGFCEAHRTEAWAAAARTMGGQRCA